MAKYSFGEHLTQAEHVVSAKLGATNAKMVDADVGHAVKLAADSRFDKCADGDQVEGFVKSIEPFTVEDSSFGSVQLAGFKSVTVTGPIAIGDYVVAGATGKLKKAPALVVDDTTTVRNYHWRYVSGEVNGGAVDCAGVVMRVA
jgi:hypothetical protein